MDKEKRQAVIEEKKARRELYLKREKEMLDGGVQSYGMGSRNLTRYTTELKAVQDAIDRLGEEIRELETGKRRASVGVVIHDW